MKILAFDTSNQTLSVALLEDHHLIADLTLTVKKNHSISLMPVIDFLMKQAGWQATDLARVVVAQGPGSYTGLRIAVATAKVLATTLKVELVGVSSLQVLVPEDIDGTVIPLINARRNHVYAGVYQAKQVVIAEAHQDFAQLLNQLAHLDGPVTFVGEVSAFEQQIREKLPHARIQETQPSAYRLGCLGATLPAQDAETFVPRYLKRVEAEEQWLEKQGDKPIVNGNYISKV